jgi:hypothetical protein
MIEQIGIEANQALEGETINSDSKEKITSVNNFLIAFNRARGHSMEKYTEDLLGRKPFSYENIKISSMHHSTSLNSVDQTKNPTCPP